MDRVRAEEGVAAAIVGSPLRGATRSVKAMPAMLEAVAAVCARRRANRDSRRLISHGKLEAPRFRIAHQAYRHPNSRRGTVISNSAATGQNRVTAF